MALLTFDTLSKPKPELIMVEGLGEMYVKPLTLKAMREATEGDDYLGKTEQIVADLACDEQGGPLFTKEQLGNLPAGTVMKIADAIVKHSVPQNPA